MLTTAGRECCRRSSHRAPAAAHTVRAPAALRHFPARFRGTFCAPQLSGERRGAASGSFGESPTSCTEYRGAFSAPEAFVPHALTSARRAATGAQSTNPATVPPPAKLFCSVRTINLESAAERARRALAPTHIFLGASGAARLSSLQCGSASRSRSASSLERAAERPRSVLVSPTPCTRP